MAITLFDFVYPLPDFSDPLRKEGLPFTYYPFCGAVIPDDDIKIHTRGDGSELYSGTPYPKRYSKRAIIGKILGIKPGFIFLDANPYNYKRDNIKWLNQRYAYKYKKRDEEILKATLDKIKRDNLCPSILDHEKFFQKTSGNLH